jgi:hypothetical protein
MAERQLNLRKLRIAWSVAWGMTCLLLIATCFALQYRGADFGLMRRGGPGPTNVWIDKDKHLALSWEPRAPYRPKWAGQTNHYGFRYNMYSNGSWYVRGPLWAVGALLATFAAAVAAWPWLAWRYSLRTLLFATTIAAVGLGLIVWAAG